MKADGGVKWINSNIIKHQKEFFFFFKKGDVENCGSSRGFGFIYINRLVLCPFNTRLNKKKIICKLNALIKKSYIN